MSLPAGLAPCRFTKPRAKSRAQSGGLLALHGNTFGKAAGTSSRNVTKTKQAYNTFTKRQWTPHLGPDGKRVQGATPWPPPGQDGSDHRRPGAGTEAVIGFPTTGIRPGLNICETPRDRAWRTLRLPNRLPTHFRLQTGLFRLLCVIRMERSTTCCASFPSAPQFVTRFHCPFPAFAPKCDGSPSGRAVPVVISPSRTVFTPECDDGSSDREASSVLRPPLRASSKARRATMAA